MPEIRSHVVLHRAEGSGKNRKHVAHPAIVIAQRDELLTVAFVDPALVYRLNDINWSDAFERVMDVPPESEDNGHYYYTLPDEPKSLSPDDSEAKKLQAFLLSNFKSETGNETPVDCAIRLLSKSKKK